MPSPKPNSQNPIHNQVKAYYHTGRQKSTRALAGFLWERPIRILTGCPQIKTHQSFNWAFVRESIESKLSSILPKLSLRNKVRINQALVQTPTKRLKFNTKSSSKPHRTALNFAQFYFLSTRKAAIIRYPKSLPNPIKNTIQKTWFCNGLSAFRYDVLTKNLPKIYDHIATKLLLFYFSIDSSLLIPLPDYCFTWFLVDYLLFLMGPKSQKAENFRCGLLGFVYLWLAPARKYWCYG